MLTSQDKQMFEMLGRDNTRLRAWLHAELAKKLDVLVKMNDVEQLRRTQGYAQCLQTILDYTDPNPVSPRTHAGSST